MTTSFHTFTKRLADLEPPRFRLDSPYDRFTADLQRLNHFLWSTETSYATTLADYLRYEGDATPAKTALAHSRASSFSPRTRGGKPHYGATMGSLLVQLRWNYDALGRYTLIEAVSSLERFATELLSGMVGDAASGPWYAIRNLLQKRGVMLDAVMTYRAQLYKVIRNDLVHDRSTIHAFPSPGFSQRAGEARRQALPWSSASDWDDTLRRVFNEVLVTTRVRADTYDLPHLFFIGIFALSRLGEFGAHLNEVVEKAGAIP